MKISEVTDTASTSKIPVPEEFLEDSDLDDLDDDIKHIKIRGEHHKGYNYGKKDDEGVRLKH